MARAADELRAGAQQLHDLAEPIEMPWETLPRRQQQVLTRLLMGSLEQRTENVELRPADIRSWFEVSAPTARAWLHDWMDEGFIEPATARTQRVRRYRLSPEWRSMIEHAVRALEQRG